MMVGVWRRTGTVRLCRGAGGGTSLKGGVKRDGHCRIRRLGSESTRSKELWNTKSENHLAEEQVMRPETCQARARRSGESTTGSAGQEYMRASLAWSDAKTAGIDETQSNRAFIATMADRQPDGTAGKYHQHRLRNEGMPIHTRFCSLCPFQEAPKTRPE